MNIYSHKTVIFQLDGENKFEKKNTYQIQLNTMRLFKLYIQRHDLYTTTAVYFIILTHIFRLIEATCLIKYAILEKQYVYFTYNDVQ